MKIRKRLSRKGTVSWQADLGVVQGKRVQISCKTKAEAEGLIERKKAERKRLGEAGLSLSDADRNRFAAARDRLDAAGATIEEAVTYFLRHAKPSNGGVTFAALVSQCVADKRAQGRSDDYCETLRRMGKNFGLAGHADKMAHLISSEEIAAYIQGNGWSPKSQNIYLTDLSSIFSWGVEKKFVSFNPCDAVSRPRIADKAPEIFTVDECEALMAAALATHDPEGHYPPRLELLPYIAICLFAGVRMEECAKMRWESVNLEERFIEITAAVAKRVKGVKRRIIPMSENLAAWLELARVKEGLIAPGGRAKRMRKLRDYAEEMCRQGPLKAGERPKRMRWPDRVLRHSFASYHLAKYRNAEQTRLDMGHHDTAMLFNHYRELVRPKDAEAFWKIAPAD